MHHYSDLLYGTWNIPDGVARIIGGPTFQRLRRVSQSGASKYAHAFKTVTRFEHSMGVYLLLCHLGATERERVAGLLHDISHTAFSHVIDIVFFSEEQDFHEQIKDQFLARPDLKYALANLGYRVEDVSDEDSFTILEQPLPALCADRLDYFLRDLEFLFYNPTRIEFGKARQSINILADNAMAFARSMGMEEAMTRNDMVKIFHLAA